MILSDSEGHVELDPADVSVLIERQLVRLEAAAPDHGQIRLTGQGWHLLHTMGKAR